MKIFEQKAIREAQAHAIAGGQALHLHRMLTPTAPKCFVAAVNRGEDIAHLFDQNTERLQQTAKFLGVRVIFIDKPGTSGQHIDLCGGPLRKALQEAQGRMF